MSANSKYLDLEGLEELINFIGEYLAAKVDKEDSKVLSSNDFTDTLKYKLENLQPITREEIKNLFSN